MTNSRLMTDQMDSSGDGTVAVEIPMQTDETESDRFLTNSSNLDTSFEMHNSYCEPVGTLDNRIHQECQTPVWKTTRDASNQTEPCNHLCQNRYSQTSTSLTEMCDQCTQVEKPTLTFEDIKDSDEKIMFYTGIPNSYSFEGLFEQLKDNAVKNTSRQQVHFDSMEEEEEDEVILGKGGGRPRSLRVIDEFLLVLMRLRLGLLLEDLSERFKISNKTCSTIFNTWIDFLDKELSFLVQWPSKERVKEYMLDAFRSRYPNCRVVIDCTEVFTETPRSLSLKSALYSDYKSHMTLKSLVGISPAGVVTFVSDLYSGSTSDKQLTLKCGIVDLCEEGDSIMVDKGFRIADITTPKSVNLIIPPFKDKSRKFTKREVEQTKTIANLRIHVERQMERIKNFPILQGVIPMSMSNHASQIWKTCTRLTNLEPPLVYK